MNLLQWNLPSALVESYKQLGLKELFQWQVDCLSSPGVLDGKNLVYSAPTGAGKSLVAEILLLRKFLKTKKKIIFVLPFVSLAREKMFRMRNVFEILGIRVDGYMGGLSPSGGFAEVDVAVCTIEKANALINKLIDENQLSSLGMIVVDEIHMVGDFNRGYLIELLLTKIKYLNGLKNHSTKSPNNISMVGMSATVPNLELLATWLDAEFYQTDFRPVPLTNYLKVGMELFDVKFNKVRDVDTDPRLKNDEDGISNLCLEILKNGHSVLVFCPTKNWCENLAVSIAKNFFLLSSNGFLGFDLSLTSINDVVEQLRRSPAGLDSVLKKTVPLAVAYHHAGLTTEERDIVETGFRNNIIRVLIATSTLSSGVNLPARRVIIRSPGMNRGLIDVRSYHQMAGRAGRKGIDDVGESVLICKPHEKNKGMKLLSSSLPPVKSCLVGDPAFLNEVTSAVRRAILEVIVNQIASSKKEVKSYIKCTLLFAQMASNKHSSSNRTRSMSDVDANMDELINNCINWLNDHEFVHVQDTELSTSSITPSKLGHAALMSSLPTSEALRVLADLQAASKAFVLDSELHLVYQITPIHHLSSNLNWFNFLNIYESLSPAHHRVADLVGIDEGFLTRLASSGGFKSTHRLSESKKHLLNIHCRFYSALILHDLVQELPLGEVCEKYGENRGIVQSLQQSAAMFAGMVTAFCQQLGWWSFETLLRQFQSRLVFGVQRELLDLMQISLLNSVRARALYETGITSCLAVASSKATDVEVILRNAVKFTSKRDIKDDHHPLSLRGIRVPGSNKALTEKEAAAWIVNEAKSICGISNESQDNSDSNLFNMTSSRIEEAMQENNNWDGTNLAAANDSKLVLNDHLLNCSPSCASKVDIVHNDLIVSQLQSETNCVDTVESRSEKNTSITESQLAVILEEDFSIDSRKLPIKTEHSTNPTSSTPLSRCVRKSSDSIEFSNLIVDQKCETRFRELETNVEHDTSSSSLNELFSSSNDFSGDMFDAPSSDDKKTKTTDEPDAKESYINWSTESVFQCQTAQELINHRINAKQTRDDQSLISCEADLSNYIDLNQEARSKSIVYVESQLSKLSISNCQSNGDDTSFLNDTDPFITDLAEMNDKKKTLEIVYLSTRRLFQMFLKKWKKQLKFSITVSVEDHDKNSQCEQHSTTSISFAWYWSNSIYLFSDSIASKSSSNSEFLIKICQTLESISFQTLLITLNAKKLIKLILKYLGCDLHALHWIDTDTASWILDPDNPHQDVMTECFQQSAPSQFQNFKELRRRGDYPCGVSRDQLELCLEAISSYHVMNWLEAKLRDQSLWESFINLEMPHESSMALMESNGISIDTTRLKSLLNELFARKQDIEGKIFKLVGRQLNLTSVPEVRKIFIELGIVNKSLGKNWSTNKDMLNRLQQESNCHPLVALLSGWRSIQYAFTCVHQINRSLLSFSSQSGAIVRRYYPVTHLTSIGKVNMKMQFVPKTKRLAYDDSAYLDDYCFSLREFFVASEGFVLLSADYSQLELRIMAHFSGDELLLESFNCNRDLFRELAAEFYNKQDNPSTVTDEERSVAKEIVYALNYGVGSKNLSMKINLSETETDLFRQKFTDSYPRLHIYFKHLIGECRKNGHVSTLLGRRRFLPNIKHRDGELRARAERQARNSVIAGSAADLVKTATLKIAAMMKNRGWNITRRCSANLSGDQNSCFLIHQLHDELIYEVKSHLVNEAAQIVRDCMISSLPLKVKLAVKLKTGLSWQNLEPYSIQR